MKRVVIAALALLVITACRPPDEGAATSSGAPAGIEARIELGAPAAIGPAAVRVHVGGSPAAQVNSVTVTADMTHAGMVPVIVPAAETEPGVWLAQDFAFTMAGDWFLLADIELEDGTGFDLTLPVNVRSD